MRRPTEPGYYWFKGTNTNSISGVITSISAPVQFKPNGFVEGFEKALSLKEMDGEWTKLEEPQPKRNPTLKDVPPGQVFRWCGGLFVKLDTAGHPEGHTCVPVGHFRSMKLDEPVDF